MHQASVGFHCPECVASGKQRVIKGRSAFSAWRGQPRVTQTLVFVNVVIYILSIGGSRGLGLRPEVLRDWSTWGPAIDVQDEWWRLITGGFLHDGVFHIGFNMLLLWLLGRQLEAAIGSWRFGLLYAVSLLAGSFGAVLADPDVPVVGASGAVYGLMGATILAQRAYGISVWDSGIGTLVVLNLLISFTVSTISVGGHIGGLVGGAIVGWLYYESPKLTQTRWAGDIAAVLLGVAAFAGGMWAATTWTSPLF